MSRQVYVSVLASAIIVLWKSSAVRLNSANPRPSDFANSGSFFGPTTIRAITKIISNSCMPMPNIVRTLS